MSNLDDARLVFRWFPENQKEIKDRRMGRGRTPKLQAHINQLHIDYIGTRDGTEINDGNSHGLFGTFIDEDDDLVEVENLPLKKIDKKIREITKKQIDIYKTVFTLREEDAINLRNG